MRFHLRSLTLIAALCLAAACASSPQPPPAAASVDAISWPVTRPKGVPRARLELRRVTDDAEASISTQDADGSPLRLAKEPILTSRDLARVEVTLEYDLEHYAVTLFFEPRGARRLAAATRDRLGARLAVMVDGEVLFAPQIQAVLGESAMISSGFDRAAATRLAERLAP